MEQGHSIPIVTNADAPGKSGTYVWAGFTQRKSAVKAGKVSKKNPRSHQRAKGTSTGDSNLSTLDVPKWEDET